MIELFDNPLSPYAFKVRVVLYEKEIPFERHEIQKQSQREELLRLNPRGEVPALRDGDAGIYDSKVMCEYIEEKWPAPPLLPKDPVRRAAVRNLELVADTQIDACVFVVSLFRVFRPGLVTSHASSLEAISGLFEKYQESLDRQLANGDYLAGEFSRADITTYPHVAIAAFMGHAVKPEHKRLAAWVERMQARASVQRATEEALGSFSASQGKTDTFFSNEHIHWRSDRIECALRVGLGSWLQEELAAKRAFFSPVP